MAMTQYLCDFLPGKDGSHNHGSLKAAKDCREKWKAWREVSPKRPYDWSPHRQPTLEPKFY